MDKVKQFLLADFKRSNKARKEKLALKFSFKNAVEYLAYLEGKTLTDSPILSKIEEKLTIHNVFILDASGSMLGSKYNNGINGIKQLIKSIKEDKFTNNTITIVEFNSKKGTVTHYWLKSSKDVKVDFDYIRADGRTPLYQTLGKVIDNLLSDLNIKKEDKVLLNVTTDGQDTAGWGNYYNLPQTLKSIQEKNNFTVTFVGTEEDVKYTISNLNLDSSNTLIHDNTGQGVLDAFINTVQSRIAYSKSVSKGEDVSVGFYKKLI